jgi:YrbI family 3-deoxy-D-manno-octulosonate 8-phosphate phosphatase
VTGNVAIIPARGGSKGIPRKNVLPIAGKPLIGWTIEAALAADSVDSVLVSTDNPEIAKVAEEFGASVVWRPLEISGDLSSSEAALLHALETQYPEPTIPPELTVFLQCTAPLMTAEDIDGTVEALRQQDADTALAVADFHYFLWKLDADRNLVGVNHDKSVRQMRQEREHQYLEAGAIYVMKTSGFLAHQHRFFGKTAHYVLPPDRVMEVDEPVDFHIAQILLEQRQQQRSRQLLPTKIDLLVFDFDGVMTDDRVSVNEDGLESITCSRSDGMGIKLARERGHRMLILSTEKNGVVRKRAEKLGLEVLHGIDDKVTVLDKYLTDNGLQWQNVVYVGNDVNDVACLLRAGCGVAVANATREARESANMVLTRAGGNHAVRELIDLILQDSE